MATSSKFFLSLIVPTFRQEKSILRNIRQLKRTLDKVRYKYEIIVVVDGLVDRTREKVLQSHFKKTRVVFYKKNQGKAYAIRKGMHVARGNHVMFIDSGMEIDPSGITMLVEHMKWYEADIIVGSKRHPASLVKYSTIRKILSYGYYHLVKFFFHLKITDTQAGIKIFRKKVLKKILPMLMEKKFAGDLEMLVAAKCSGFQRIYEAPIKLNYELGGVSSAATLKQIWLILVDTLAIIFRVYILQYYTHWHRRHSVAKVHTSLKYAKT